MFASLREYREKHPYVYILRDQSVFRYEIFSSYLAKADSNAYALEFSELFWFSPTDDWDIPSFDGIFLRQLLWCGQTRRTQADQRHRGVIFRRPAALPQKFSRQIPEGFLRGYLRHLL